MQTKLKQQRIFDEFLKYLNKNILIHYTGKTIISSKFSTMNKILNQNILGK